MYQISSIITRFLNSDAQQYGGSGQVNKKRLKTILEPYHNQAAHVEITIPPFGVSILRPVKTRKGAKQDGSKQKCVAMLLAGEKVVD